MDSLIWAKITSVQKTLMIDLGKDEKELELRFMIDQIKLNKETAESS